MWEALVSGIKDFGGGLANFFTSGVGADKVGNIMNAGGVFDPLKNTITDTSGNVYNLLGDGSLQGAGLASKSMNWLDANKDGLNALGSIGTGYGKWKESQMAQEALNLKKNEINRANAQRDAMAATIKRVDDKTYGAL